MPFMCHFAFFLTSSKHFVHLFFNKYHFIWCLLIGFLLLLNLYFMVKHMISLLLTISVLLHFAILHLLSSDRHPIIRTKNSSFFFRYSETWKITSGEMYTIQQKVVFRNSVFPRLLFFLLSICSNPTINKHHFPLPLQSQLLSFSLDHTPYTQKPISIDNAFFSSWFSPPWAHSIP